MIGLTERELAIIQDQEFLLTKARASAKIYNILSKTQDELKKIVDNSVLTEEQKKVFKSNKISKGENYMGLPYQVLDYPAYFSQKDSFAFRTMFWWGNFFSSTIQLEGQFLEHFREQIIKSLDELVKSEIFICIGDDPWQYHFGKDNYTPLAHDHETFIVNCSFLKLSKKTGLGEWQDLPQWSAKFLHQVLKILVPS